MNLRRSSAAAVIAAALTAFTIAGCSTTLVGSPTAASKVAPTTDEQETPSEGTDSSETVESGSTEPETSAVLPPTDPTSSESTATSAAGPGGQLDTDSVNWLTSFCTGFVDVMAYAGPDTTGMSDEATIQTIVDSYDAMSSAAASLATDLQTVPQPTFSDAPIMTSAISTWLQSITMVYGMGAQQIANQTFTSADELTQVISQIEAGMDQPSKDLTTAMGQVDPAVRSAMSKIPECSALSG